MAWLDDVATSAVGKLEGKAGSWLDNGMAEARRMATEHLPQESIPDALRAIERLEDVKPALAHMTKGSFTTFLVHASMGNITRARLEFLRDAATFEERRAASHAAGARVYKDALDRDAALDQVLQVLKDIGSLALTKVLPCLLAAI